MLANICGNLGAALLIAAPFLIDTTPGKLLAISGLALLTVQAIDRKMWNLVALNFAGIIGYCYALYF